MSKQMVTLGSIIVSKGLQTGPFGSQLKANEYTGTGIPVVMPKDISNGEIITDEIARGPEAKARKLAKHQIVPGDIIFPRRGDLGRIGVAKKENESWLCGTGCLRARLIDGVDSNYIHQYVQLTSVKKWLERNALGQTMLNLNTGIISNLPVYLTPLPGQTAIANLLSTGDAAIEKTEKLIAAKERRLNALYQRFFRPGTSVNASWHLRKLGQFVSSRKERSLPSKETPLFSLTIEDGVTPKTDRYNRDFLVKDNGSKTYKVVHPGDIVFNPANLRWGAIARSHIKHKVVISPIYEILEIRKSNIDPDFLEHALTCPRQIGIFATRTEGTLIERMAVKLDAFLLTKIMVPSNKEEQREVASFFNLAKSEIELLKNQADAYRKQKQGLMQKLLTGLWRIKHKEARYEP